MSLPAASPASQSTSSPLPESSPSTPISRKKARKARQQGASSSSLSPTPSSNSSTSSDDDCAITLPSPQSPSPPTNHRKQNPPPTLAPLLPSPTITSLTMSAPTRLLIASIGNPAPYLNTLHSAGHTVLHSLALALQLPSLAKSRMHGNGLVSTSTTPDLPITLWQSPSLMNISGVALASAWKTFVSQNQTYDGDVGLVVLHDELELALGQVRVKSGTLSAKGHNGLKSIKEKLPNVEYTRIGVGIGRPVSREKDAVAAYVLGKMSAGQRAAVVGSASRVEAEIRKLVGGI